MFKNTPSPNIKYLRVILPILIIGVSLLFLFFYFKINTTGYLNFSDGAKFADVARNVVQGRGYGSSFTFYSQDLVSKSQGTTFSARGIPVAMPYSIATSFRLFGISDFSVIAASGFFYLLLIVSVFLLARKLFGNLVATVSAVAVAFNINFLSYATSGASEPLFAFLSTLSAYLLFVRRRWANVLFIVSLVALYLTRPQGVVFILVFLLSWLLLNFSCKRGLTYFIVLTFGILVIDKLVLYPLSFKYPVYPIVTRGIQAIFQYSPSTAVSDALRGQTTNVVSWAEVLKKTFYNLYNFYKLLPNIASPYMWGLFVVGVFIWTKEKNRNVFNILTVLVTTGSFLLTALTIPFFRYIHPAVPLIYILAANTLVWIMARISKSKFLISNQILNSKFKILNTHFVAISCFVLILFFVVGQTLGAIFLDSRFEKNTHNVGKPPIYVVLGQILKENTNSNQVAITNLDTWGSWYGERKTVWFPLEPKQLIDPATGTIPLDGIYLTSYLVDDENYYMGSDWRLIFNNPSDPKKWTCDGCGEIAKEFNLKGVYKVNAADDYERQDASAILLLKK